ncbi:hypothetical protein [Chryseobacterium sp. M5A1_1a]
MENTLENKSKFFARYWGQEVLNGNGLIYSATMKTKLSDNGDFLELKPLSSITDEDAIQGILLLYNESIEDLGEIIEISHRDTFSSITTIDKGTTFKTNRSIHHWEGILKIGSTESDFFCSKGYAVQWMKLSVETQIEFGWVKLKNN